MAGVSPDHLAGSTLSVRGKARSLVRLPAALFSTCKDARTWTPTERVCRSLHGAQPVPQLPST